MSPPPGPLLRRGPRPLLLHLTLAMLRSQGWQSASPNWNAGWPSGNPEALATLVAALSGGAPPEAMLAGEAKLIAGIAAYRRHPWRRDVADPPAVWTEGETRLLDYGGTGPVLLVVPSLVNRATVLDLLPERSMLRHLASAGLRVKLLDWGWPGPVERAFTLTDYIAGRLERALIAAAADGPVILAGYCMGGLLAVAAAARRPELVRGLALLATPWDFHAADPQTAASVARLLPLLEPAMQLSGTLSIDALQLLFALLDPDGIAGKYRGFADVDPDSARARSFVALEDWLNDGVPLAAPVARECLGGWYGRNTPAAGAWRIAGLPVEPGRLAVPSFVAVPARDRIVPPESARPLAALIPGAVLHAPAAGHVGMIAGAHAEAELWRPLAGVGPIPLSRIAGALD